MPEPLIGRVVRRQRWLEPLSDFTQKVVGGTFRAFGPLGRPIRNLLAGTWLLKHPLHPLLTDVPVGAWTVGLIADYAAHFTNSIPESAGDVALIVGFLVAVLALITGYTDFFDTFGLERRFGCAHGLLMTLVVGVDGVSVLLRWLGSQSLHPLALALSTAGYAILVVGAWIGGHEVFAIGYNVNRNAFIASGPDDWTAAGSASDVPAGGMIAVDVAGMRVLLARDRGRICALSDTCTHVGAPLHEGTLQHGVITCPWHASRFRLSDGGCIGAPASQDLPQLLVREVDGSVQVKLQEPLHDA